jgi:hypothetical protein
MILQTHEAAVAEWERCLEIEHPWGRKLITEYVTFVAEHPEILDAFRKFARVAARRHKIIGIDVVRGRVRWETFISYDDRDYKVSNDYSPLFARHLQVIDPTLVGLFRIKRWPMRSEGEEEDLDGNGE